MVRTKEIILLVFLLVPLTNVFGQFDDLMMKGNNFYQDEQFEEAISIYQRIVDNGYESGALFYNLGNSYFRLGKLGQAILSFEKALKLEPGDEDAEYNLRLANARIVDKIKELPEVPLLEYWGIVVTAFTPSGWLTIFIVFWIMLLLSVAGYFLLGRVRYQRLATMLGLFNITMILIVSVFMFSSIHRESTSTYGVLLKSVETAKAGPDEAQNDAFVVHEGLKFEIEEELGEWSKIKLSDGTVGWLPNDTFEAI